MSLYSGSGGKIVVLSHSSAELQVGNYRLRKLARLADTTNSSTGGGEQRKKVVKGGQLNAEVFWDSANTPETLGIDEGEEWTAALYLGDSTLKHNSCTFITESLEVTGCDQNGVVRYALSAFHQGILPDPA